MNNQDGLGDSTQDSATSGPGSGPAPRAGQGDDGSRISTQALIWGLIGIPFAWLLVPPIVAIVLGVKGRRRSRLATGRTNGKATVGLVLGVVMICMLVFWLGVVVLVSMMLSDGLERRAESMTITQLKDCGKSLEAIS